MAADSVSELQVPTAELVVGFGSLLVVIVLIAVVVMLVRRSKRRRVELEARVGELERTRSTRPTPR